MSSLRTWATKVLEHVVAWWYLLKAYLGGSHLDVSQINPQLWTGGALTTDADVVQLVASGVTADIDCREEFNDRSLVDGYNGIPPTPDRARNHPRLDYYYAGVPDDGQPKPVSWFAGAWTFAKPILEDNRSLLSHCAAGVNRGPSMAYFLLRAHWKLSPQDALTAIKQVRPQVGVAYRADADQAITALGL